MTGGGYLKQAVAFGDLKTASLYFDHVVPVFAVLEYATSISKRSDDFEFLRREVLGDLIPPELGRKLGFAGDLGDLNQASFNLFAKMSIAKFGFPEEIKGLTREQYESVEVDCGNAYMSFVRKYGLEDWPLVAGGEATTAGLPDDAAVDSSPLLVVSQLKLVDGSSLSWEHVHELRKDTSAQDALRRLRLFAFSNYSGKSRAFIEDDLLARIAAYEASVKKWGLETVQGTLSTVLNSKGAAGAFASSFVAAAFGAPLAAVVSGGLGLCIEVGNVALELQKRRLALDTLTRENPVSYVTYVKRERGGGDAR